jgi:hypothetical protein
VLRSYSVIVPVLNKRAAIGRTLESIATSMDFFARHYAWAERFHGEIVVVDEGSTDGTADVVREFTRTDARATLIAHRRSLGIGPARNTGVRISRGDVLFFCDGDDLFLPEHVLVGAAILDRSEMSADRTEEPWLLRIGSSGHLSWRSFRPVAAVKTAVRLGDPVHPYWKRVVANSLAQTACVRREYHEWGEGFPEQAVYKFIGGCEDGAYNQALQIFCRLHWVEMETVEYVRYPGNSLDLQMPRFQQPPGPMADTATPTQRAAHAIRTRLEDQKIGYLLDKWLVLGPPPLPASMLNWTGVVGELVRRGRRQDAETVAAQAAGAGYPVAEDDEPARLREQE